MNTTPNTAAQVKPISATIGLSYWLARRSSDPVRRLHAKADTRRALRQLHEASPKGKGRKAWRRVDAMNREPGCLIWPDYAL